MAEVGDAALRAATISGFRQALEQNAAQLEHQIAAWRREVDAELAAAKRRRAREKAEARKAEVERWCSALEHIAQIWKTKAQADLIEQKKAEAEASRPLGIREFDRPSTFGDELLELVLRHRRRRRR